LVYQRLGYRNSSMMDIDWALYPAPGAVLLSIVLAADPRWISVLV
jgi:hypothetical protein